MSSTLEAKIVVLGAQGVGKTSLVMRYCKGTFVPSQITSTVGASFLTKRVVDTDTDTLVRLQIWDTGMLLSSSSFSSILSRDNKQIH
jgi:GTPase SAR1 family protein